MTNTLQAGEKLTPGQKLQSIDGHWELTYQTNGNLVLSEDGRIDWQTNTGGKAAGEAVMQTDGHFLLYTPEHAWYWKTGVFGFSGGKLVLDNDGDLVVFKANNQVAWRARRNTLKAGEKLVPGQKLQSFNGRWELTYQADGDLVLSKDGSRMWQSRTSGKPAGEAVMQTDGHFCLYSPVPAVYWKTGVFGFSDGRLVLGNDGDLVVLRGAAEVAWRANRNTLFPDDQLTPGRKLSSLNGQWELVYQTDGNLVLYQQGYLRWQSNTSGQDAGTAVMRGDCCLCLYDPEGVAYWTATPDAPNSAGRLVLDDWGNLQVLVGDSAVWAAVKSPPRSTLHPSGNTLGPGEKLTPGQRLQSPNGQWQLVYEVDANLVLYLDKHRVWTTATSGKVAGQAVMQSDGHFVLYNPQHVFYWKTGVLGFSDGRLVLDDEGNLVVLRGADEVAWRARRTVLLPGEKLTLGQKLLSLDGRWQLVYEVDADQITNLVVYDEEGRVEWRTHTAGLAVGEAMLSPDGELILRNAQYPKYWSNGVSGFSDGKLVLRNDGELVVLRGDDQVAWSTRRNILIQSHELLPGDRLQSPNRQWELCIGEEDGNLYLLKDGVTVWATHERDRRGFSCLACVSKQLYLYDWEGRDRYWESFVSDYLSNRLVLKDSGELLMMGYDAERGVDNRVAWRALPLPPASPLTLRGGEGLLPGQELQSPDGRWALIYQGDGNLVLTENGAITWQTSISGKLGGHAILRDDGLLCLVDQGGRVYWKVGVQYLFDVRLALTDFGVPTLLQDDDTVIWRARHDSPPPLIVARDSLRAGTALTPGQKLQSLNGRFQLIYQADGNLVLYNDGAVAWHTRTNGKPAGEARLQATGRFALSSPGPVVYWEVGAQGLNSGRLLVDDDGAMFLLSAEWSVGQQATLFDPYGRKAATAVNMGNTLRPGAKLTPGQKLQSANGRYELIYQTDGNLVLYALGFAVWCTHTQSPGEVVMQLDGRLVIDGTDWSSGVSGFRGRLVLDDDGVLTVFREVWQFPRSRDVLSAGQTLTPGKQLQSANGRFELIYQADGDLVLKDAGHFVWHTRTAGEPAGAATMQADGEFCLVGPDNTGYWGTKTGGATNAKLLLSDAGSLSVVRSNNTVAWTVRSARGNALSPGDILYPGELRRSNNGRFELTYQTDGDLVIYDGNRRAWHSGTSGKAAGKASLQPDGGLRLSSPDNVVYWTNAAGGLGGVKLVLRDDGAAVLLRADQKILWKASPAFDNVLRAGDALNPGAVLLSPDRTYQLIYQPDGNLVLYKRTGLGYNENPAKWHTNTAGRPAGAAVLRADGRLVLCGPDHAEGTKNVYWSCQTEVSWTVGTWIGGDEGSRGDSMLVLANDGGIDLQWAGRDVWTNNFLKTSVGPGSVLYPGQRIQDDHNTWKMIYQDDGELVVYYRGSYMWGSGTSDQPAGRAQMGTDGIFRLYTPADAIYWQMGPLGYAGSSLIVDMRMGRPALYKLPMGLYYVQPAQPQGHTLLPNQTLRRGQSLRSRDGEWTLDFNSDSMLGLYQGRTRVWTTGNVGTAMLTSDGEFVLLASIDPPVISWRCKVSAGSGGKLELTDDGALVLSNPDGTVWSAQAGDTRAGVIGVREGQP